MPRFQAMILNSVVLYEVLTDSRVVGVCGPEEDVPGPIAKHTRNIIDGLQSAGVVWFTLENVDNLILVVTDNVYKDLDGTLKESINPPSVECVVQHILERRST